MSLCSFTKTRRELRKKNQGKERKRINRSQGSTKPFSIDPGTGE